MSALKKSSGHKAVKFGMNTYVRWDYNLTKKSFNCEGVRLKMSLFCVDLLWNKPMMAFLNRSWENKSLNRMVASIPRI
jgi:hypothetical protein